MNGFTGNRAQGSGKHGSHEQVFTWNASADMLPLVGRIAQDVVQNRQRLGRLQKEQSSLDASKRTLDWKARSRRYEVQEEIGRAEAELRAHQAELEALGLTLLDADVGLVGVPTIVNDRSAFFSGQRGEERLAS